MALLEAVTIEVGAAIAKSILKIWVKDSSLGEDITSSLIDLFKAKTSDALAQRKGNRQFETIGEKVGENLLPLFQLEGAKLDEGSRTAVAYAVAETFNKARLSSEILAERNLEPTELEKHILSARPQEVQRFSLDEQAFYDRIIKEACVYTVDIASQLPAFTERTFAEVLKREDQIIARTEEILSDLKQLRQQLDPMIEAERFEIDYRQAVARNLDVLHLIGADVSLPNRRHRLSVAYITLSVEQQEQQPMLPGVPRSSIIENGNGEDDILEDGPPQVIVPVDVALSQSQRLLIRGPAGSGKTTLLQWIAVKAATKSFADVLEGWNGSLPFYIRLRHCVNTGLPRPEAFPGFVAPAIADTMPKGWVHNKLKAGHVLVLVDGVDEVPAAQREDVHDWLSDLVATYPKAHFVVTSRPSAIEEGWMNNEAFGSAELQPMERADIEAFIEHWHEAVRAELTTDEEKNELAPLADHLKEHIRRVRPIRNLATTPLLCAMLCALNRDRRRQLPVNRIELYRACCSMLLERRDKESRVDLSDYPAINYSQKSRLLEELAYWMIKEGLSETTVAVVDDTFTSKLANMPGIAQDVIGPNVRKFFVERSGIIREPVATQIDFTHRTFQEFFAAQAALDAMNLPLLLTKAHNDQWREVIILAAGLASKAICEQLITGLIKRGDDDKALRYQLHLLAVSCLETAIELGPEVRAEVEQRLSKMIPPKNVTEAKELAAAGELAVKYLERKVGYKAAEAAACVRALALIGGDIALDTLESYINDSRKAVGIELIKAQTSFDETYEQRILSHVIPRLFGNTSELRIYNILTASSLPSLSGFQHLTNLTTLDLTLCSQISDLTPLATLTNLTSLDLQYCKQVTDLTPLAHLTNLTSLNLQHCGQITNLAPLASLRNLTLLNLGDCSQISDLNILAKLIRLEGLYFYGLSDQVKATIPQSVRKRLRISD